jgi:hypothetical protein
MPGFKVYQTEVNGAAVPEGVLLKHQWLIKKLGPILVDSMSPARYARGITLPKISFDEEAVDGGAIRYKFARFVGWDDVRIEFYDTEGLTAKLDAWRAQVGTADAGIGFASDYKKQSTILLIDGDGNPVVTVDLMNSWPKQIAYGDLTYTDSDAKIVEVTLSYDYAVTKDAKTGAAVS